MQNPSKKVVAAADKLASAVQEVFDNSTIVGWDEVMEEEWDGSDIRQLVDCLNEYLATRKKAA